jgi:hypothetical protein
MKLRTCSNLSLVVLLQWSLVASAFSPISARSSSFSKHSEGHLAAEPDSEVATDKPDLAQNEIYIQGLINNLTTALDRWVVTGSPVKVRSTVLFHEFSWHVSQSRTAAKAHKAKSE